MSTSDVSCHIGEIFFDGSATLKLEHCKKALNYSLLYLGRSADYFMVGYRETVDGSIRNKFSENYSIHIESSSPFKFNIIGHEFEVVEVSNQKLLLHIS